MGERRLDSNWSMQVTALYDYEPEQFDELGFQEGNVLQVLRVQDDGWWSGYNVEIPNVVGLFPSNYVQAQRTVPPKRLVDAGTTPRLPVSSRQRIQQRPRYAPDTPEFEDEDVDDDKMQEPRSEYRGHIRAILQLRKNLEEAEQSSEALRDARRQAERERLRHRKSWRERKQIEEDVNHHRRQLVQANQQQQEIPPGDEDAEEEDESVFPQQQGYVHESDRQQAKDFEVDLNSNIDEKNRMQTDVGQIADTTDAANAAATLIVRRYRQHIASVQYNREREKEAEQQKLSKIAAVCIQHAYSRQRKRRQHELEQHRARQRLKREVDAATEIQKWIRLRWACFWRKRVQIVREERTAKEAQQCTEMMKAELRQAQLEEKLRLDADNEEVRRRLAKEEESRHIKSEEDQRRVLQQNLENKEQHRLRAVEEEVQQRSVQGESQEEECGQHDNDRAVPRQSTQAPSHEKSRRKVMKKEAVELIKSLVQQQLGDTLRDHDSKMDELQRMIVRLQTVVRKQTAMLQDSTDQLINLQMRKQEQRVPMPPRTSDTGSCSSLPRINGQSSVPRQPVAPSGLRPPRPAMSKLPGLVSVGRRTGSNESKKL